jgi:hypothetical protein
VLCYRSTVTIHQCTTAIAGRQCHWLPLSKRAGMGWQPHAWRSCYVLRAMLCWRRHNTTHERQCASVAVYGQVCAHLDIMTTERTALGAGEAESGRKPRCVGAAPPHSVPAWHGSPDRPRHRALSQLEADPNLPERSNMFQGQILMVAATKNIGTTLCLGLQAGAWCWLSRHLCRNLRAAFG